MEWPFGMRVATILLLFLTFLLLGPVCDTGHASANTTPTRLSLPDVSLCQDVGTNITIAIAASSITAVNAWQIHLTFSGLRVVAQTVGNRWTSIPDSFGVNRTGEGQTLFGFLFLRSATISFSAPVTLLTLTFRVMGNPVATSLHLDLSGSGFATEILNGDGSPQSITSTDGSFRNCTNGPIPPPPTAVIPQPTKPAPVPVVPPVASTNGPSITPQVNPVSPFPNGHRFIHEYRVMFSNVSNALPIVTTNEPVNGVKFYFDRPVPPPYLGTFALLDLENYTLASEAR